ncbi:MAG TPA: lysine--tRNA ligase [Fibrobacteraceae bacterium]|nr:lysine--tRNA ligase [Fibrobacteraceae bacterium]
MLDKNDQVEARLAKLPRLRELGVDPYPHSFSVGLDSKQLLEQKDALLAEGKPVRWAGRVVRYNRKGKMCFMHLKDRAGRLQVVVFSTNVTEMEYEVVKLLDMGDWIGVEGPCMVTQAGEFSIKVQKIVLLSKAVRPLPTPKEKVDKQGNKVVFDEFSDVELRYRQRYVDLTLNDNVREVFRKRARIIQSIREYLLEHGYLEVETPTLQPIYGGANARPFTTHHNAADMELYLRVAPELYLKRCIVGGLDRVFEFTKNFRNEGMDRTHSPEFTGLEFYEAFADYNDMMVHFEAIYESACIAANGTTKVNFQGKEIDFKAPWPRLSMYEAIQKYTDMDMEKISDDELKAEIQKRDGAPLEGEWSRGRAVIELFELAVENHLIQPTIIKDMPKESTPLCKRHRLNPDLIEQFEPYANGWELGNAYTELNDPLRQRELLEEQVARGRGGEGETHPMDENFLHSVECGLPPTGGVGFGIDRMVMLLTNQPTIRDVQLFPLMKPE